MIDTLNGDVIKKWLLHYADVIADNAAYLTDLDSAIGDADHGANMHRGMEAVIAKLPSEADVSTILKQTAMTLISTVGGSSGPLYGTLFLQMATKTAGKAELTLADWTEAFEAGVNGVMTRGKAALSDKTMLDALVPALDTLKHASESGSSLSEALDQAVQAAAVGRDATIPMLAKKGRASYLGERSIGHQDPGATSVQMLLQALAETVRA
jgi:phosphoenolpyruvate---glycerone phosphotransferase subunit DhaL